ncbi:MAG: hypothetical protein DRJ68_02370 [Thermoprotei archaeon]|nr:MAG: hypothetical protein DRJ68_02370 [Thermoprotei archaeon]
MVRVGFPLWIGDRGNFEAKLKEAYEAGFDFIELSLDFPWPIPDSSTPNLIARAMKEMGLDIALHGCWRDVKLASPISEVREASVKYVVRILDCCKALEPAYVVFHVSTDQAVSEANEYEQLIVDSAVKSVKEVVSYASKRGLEVVFENVPHQFCASLDQAVKLFRQVNGCKVCFDVGHAYAHSVRRNRNVDLYELVNSWLRELRDLIKCIHVYDCLVQGRWIDEHITPTTTSHSIKALIEASRSWSFKPAFIVIEAFKNPDGGDAKPGDLVDVVELLKRELR